MPCRCQQPESLAGVPLAGILDDVGGALRDVTSTAKSIWDDVSDGVGALAEALGVGQSAGEREALAKLRAAVIALGQLNAKLAQMQTKVGAANTEAGTLRTALQRLLNRRTYEARAAALVLAPLGIDWQVVPIAGAWLEAIPLVPVEANSTAEEIAGLAVPTFPAALAAARALGKRLATTPARVAADDDDDEFGVLGYLAAGLVGFFGGRASKGPK